MLLLLLVLVLLVLRTGQELYEHPARNDQTDDHGNPAEEAQQDRPPKHHCPSLKPPDHPRGDRGSGQLRLCVGLLGKTLRHQSATPPNRTGVAPPRWMPLKRNLNVA